jgi:dipeptidyl aminopeptidase/acylaminoacyl peptidase
MRSALLAAALVVAAPAGLLSAAPPTLDQSLSLMSVRNPRIAPDGRAVVYERQETDWKENAYVTQLFLADVASGKSVQLTRGKKPAVGAEWSPDGRWIAFLTERDGVTPPRPSPIRGRSGSSPPGAGKPGP